MKKVLDSLLNGRGPRWGVRDVLREHDVLLEITYHCV
jgi:hypothetical protein